MYSTEGVGLNSYFDSEYYRIVLELRRLGITPSGNRDLDKSKLQQVKQKINEVESKAFAIDEYIEYADEEEQIRSQLEEEKVGASILSDLNRYFILHN